MNIANIKVFAEGVEIPTLGVSREVKPGSPVQFAVYLKPARSSWLVLPGTYISVFVPYSYFDAKDGKKVEKYVLFAEGYVESRSASHDPNGSRSISLQCLGISSVMTKAYLGQSIGEEEGMPKPRLFQFFYGGQSPFRYKGKAPIPHIVGDAAAIRIYTGGSALRGAPFFEFKDQMLRMLSLGKQGAVGAFVSMVAQLPFVSATARSKFNSSKLFKRLVYFDNKVITKFVKQQHQIDQILSSIPSMDSRSTLSDLMNTYLPQIFHHWVELPSPTFTIEMFNQVKNSFKDVDILSGNKRLFEEILSPAGESGLFFGSAYTTDNSSWVSKKKLSRDRLENAANSTSVKSFLDLIAKAEVGSEWNKASAYSMRLSGHGTFDTSGGHPGKYAAGKYQFIPSTWREVSSALSLNSMSPRNQDLAAVYLLDRRGVLDDIANGNIASAITKSSNEWAGLPSGPNNKGAYDGYNGNSATISYNGAVSFYNERVGAYSGSPAGNNVWGDTGRFPVVGKEPFTGELKPSVRNAFDMAVGDWEVYYKSKYGKQAPIPYIISGYRSESHNASIGGAHGSLHTKGIAIDIDWPDGQTRDSEINNEFATFMRKYGMDNPISKHNGKSEKNHFQPMWVKPRSGVDIAGGVVSGNQSYYLDDKVSSIFDNSSPFGRDECGVLPNIIVKPYLHFAAPPSCNVLINRKGLRINFSESFSSEPTRLMVLSRTVIGALSSDPDLGGFFTEAFIGPNHLDRIDDILRGDIKNGDFRFVIGDEKFDEKKLEAGSKVKKKKTNTDLTEEERTILKGQLSRSHVVKNSQERDYLSSLISDGLDSVKAPYRKLSRLNGETFQELFTGVNPVVGRFHFNHLAQDKKLVEEYTKYNYALLARQGRMLSGDIPLDINLAVGFPMAVHDPVFGWCMGELVSTIDSITPDGIATTSFSMANTTFFSDYNSPYLKEIYKDSIGDFTTVSDSGVPVNPSIYDGDYHEANIGQKVYNQVLGVGSIIDFALKEKVPNPDMISSLGYISKMPNSEDHSSFGIFSKRPIITIDDYFKYILGVPRDSNGDYGSNETLYHADDIPEIEVFMRERRSWAYSYRYECQMSSGSASFDGFKSDALNIENIVNYGISVSGSKKPDEIKK